MDDLDGMDLGLVPITPTYEYGVEAEVGAPSAKFADDGWLRNFEPPGDPVADGYVSATVSGGWDGNTHVKGTQSGSDWWNHRPNDGNWSFSLPSETKLIEIDVAAWLGEIGYMSWGLGSTSNYGTIGVGQTEFWDIQFGMDDGGWCETQIREWNWFNLQSSGLVHNWTVGYIEYQLLLDMENKRYQMMGWGYNTGTDGVLVSNDVHGAGADGWVPIDPVATIYDRDPADLDLISDLVSPGNGLIRLQITGLGEAQAATTIPEPAGLGLLGLALLGLRKRS
jgi:hypothetical protein